MRPRHWPWAVRQRLGARRAMRTAAAPGAPPPVAAPVPPDGPESQTAPGQGSPLEVLGVALRLGLTSFGGPIAHLGYFHREYVLRRRWLDEASYADIVALCQLLPGPASSQVGIAVGFTRAGLPGALAAWAGFTLPSAVALVAFAYTLRTYDVRQAGWLHGLMVAAVAVVAQAVWSMARRLAPDRARGSLALLAAVIALSWQTAAGQVLLIAAGGLAGWLILPRADPAPPQGASGHAPVAIGRTYGVVAWAVLAALLVGLPVLRHETASHAVAVFDSFFRTGSLVFGGGHVVLPLLQREVVPPGWVTNSQFMAGYGAAQVVPGPLFTFAAYLGAVMRGQPTGWAGAILATVAIFLPSFLLLMGTLPFWEAIRRRAGFRSALAGINAAVVGILLAALYNPVWTSAIRGPADVGLAIVALGLLMLWKLPSWLVVLVAAVGGAAIAALR